MYTEEDDKLRLPIIKFLVSLILIILFILLLVWVLFRLGVGSDKYYEGLKNRMFNDNVQTMKNTGILYFTRERLPKNLDETVTITLKEMIDGKYILPIKDFDGNKCDVDKSFVSVTKKEHHYQMKVNLKCGNEEDYILTDIGCYAYCSDTFVCEKKPEVKPNPKPNPKPTPTPSPNPVYNPSCELTVNGTFGENGWYTGNALVTFKYKRPGNDSRIVAYNLYPEGSAATSNNIDNYLVSQNGVTTINGYVRDSKGRTAKCNIVVRKDNEKSSCNLYVVSGTRDSDGVFISNVVVGLNYKDSISKISNYGTTNLSTVTYNSLSQYAVTKNGVTTVYGYVKDKAGNKAVCSLIVNKKDKPSTPNVSTPSCLLEVKSGVKENDYYLSPIVVGFKNKTTTNNATITGYGLGLSETYQNNNSYAVYSNGTKTIYGYVKDSNGNKAICSITVTKKTKEYEYGKLIGNEYSNWSNWETYTYNPNNPPKFGHYNLIEIENLGKRKVVNYYKELQGEAIYQNIQVRVGTIEQKKCDGYKYYKINKSERIYAVKEGSDWKFSKMVTTTGWPTDTLTVKHEFVGFDWKCIGCERVPKKIWNKYVRSVGYVDEDKIITSGVAVSCTNYSAKKIEIYDYVKKFVRYDIIREPVYKDIYEYKRRTRKIVKKNYTDLKWSLSNNDSNLINNGYKLTGKTKLS